MYQDFLNLFQNARVITTAGTYKSTPVAGAAIGAAGKGVDLAAYLGSATLVGSPPNYATGEAVKIDIEIGQTFAGGTSVDFRLVQADVEALTTGLATVVSSGAIAIATLVKGYRPFPQFLPLSGITKRYIGIDLVTVGVMTAGIINAGIVQADQTAKSDWPAVTGF